MAGSTAIDVSSGTYDSGRGARRSTRLDADGDSDMAGPAVLLVDLGVTSGAHDGEFGAGRASRVNADGDNDISGSDALLGDLGVRSRGYGKCRRRGRRRSDDRNDR